MMGPRSDKHLGKLLKRDEARRLAEYTVSICPTFDATGKSELVGQCAILRNRQKAEVPVLPLKGKFWKSSEIYQHQLASTMGKAAKTHIAYCWGKHYCPLMLENLSDWTKPWMVKGWALQDLGPRHPALNISLTKQAHFHLWAMKWYGVCDSLTHLEGQTITKAKCWASFGHVEEASDLDDCVCARGNCQV